MIRYRITHMLLAVAVPVLMLTACAPVRPIGRDAVGRELPVVNAAVSAVTPIGFPGVFTTPWDAAPDSDAQVIYVVGTSPNGPGLFQVPWAGGEVTSIAVGEPFADPTGVAVSLDGKTVYVADGKAVLGQGAILAVDPSTGTVATVAGTEGTAPRGVEVASADDGEFVYFTGAERDTGRAAIYRVAANGGDAELLLAGAPLVEPVGVAVAADGTVYVADRLAGGDGLAAVFKVSDARAELLADGFRGGERVIGATLTQDEAVLLVSAMAPDRASAQVLGIVLESGDKLLITKEVELHPGSGGVHRAHNGNIFAWADSGGTIRQPRSGCSPCVMSITTP